VYLRPPQIQEQQPTEPMGCMWALLPGVFFAILFTAGLLHKKGVDSGNYLMLAFLFI
jgi:threonine/homoserine efflux transporter RhtA